MPYIVQFKLRTHNPQNETYDESFHAVSYKKDQYHEFFQVDAQGNRMTRRVKGDNGEILNEEVAPPIKAAFAFKDAKILYNPYKDDISVLEELWGVKYEPSEEEKAAKQLAADKASEDKSKTTKEQELLDKLKAVKTK